MGSWVCGPVVHTTSATSEVSPTIVVHSSPYAG